MQMQMQMPEYPMQMSGCQFKYVDNNSPDRKSVMKVLGLKDFVPTRIEDPTDYDPFNNVPMGGFKFPPPVSKTKAYVSVPVSMPVSVSISSVSGENINPELIGALIAYIRNDPKKLISATAVKDGSSLIGFYQTEPVVKALGTKELRKELGWTIDEVIKQSEGVLEYVQDPRPNRGENCKVIRWGKF